jgi:predicted TIM-barrel fold metal-dependent hydrolase
MDAMISADSHVVEPPDLWDRIDPEFKEQAPKLVSIDSGDGIAFPSGRVASYAGFATAGEWREASDTRQATLRPALFDPVERLVEAERDGVRSEVLFPSFAMHLYEELDASLQAACMRTYNDWILEYCSAAPDRLFGVAMLPTDPELALSELERIRSKPYKGVLVNAHPRRDRDYGTQIYEPVWEILSDSGLPACMHLYAGDSREADDHFLATYSVDPNLVQHSLALMIFSGVLERHPDLRVVAVESDIGWVAQLLRRMDHAWERKAARFNTALSSGVTPSEMFHRQVTCTFTEDRPGILCLPETGADLFMWGSDYPHNDSSWPNSQDVVSSTLGSLSEGDRRKLVHDNVVRVFGIPG